MKKQWIIAYQGNNQNNWLCCKVCKVSFDEAKREIKKVVEADRNGYKYAVFEMVYAVEYEKILKEVELEEIKVVPLEAVPGPLPDGDNDGEDADVDDFDDDF